MNLVLIVLLGILAFICVGIFFKLIKFTLKLAAMLLLFALIVLGIKLFLSVDTSVMYVIDGNTTRGFGLDGERYTFESVYDEQFNLTVADYDSVYLISSSDFLMYCGNFSQIEMCLKNETIRSLFAEIK